MGENSGALEDAVSDLHGTTQQSHKYLPKKMHLIFHLKVYIGST